MSFSPHRHFSETLRIGLPIAIGQVGVIILGFADTMMVGRYATSALAAASFVNNLFNLVTMLLLGYSYGLTPLVSGCLGRGSARSGGSVLHTALQSGASFTALIMLLCAAVFILLPWLGQPAELLPLIRPYFLLMLASMPFVMLFNLVRQFTDAFTDTAAGMWVLLIGNAFNILLNYLLIYGIGPFPEWGLTGAGVATLAARVFMALAICAYVWQNRRYRQARLGPAAVRPTPSMRRTMHRQSVPVALQLGMETGAFTASCIMAGWLGVTELAAYQVMVTIGTLGFLVYYSFGAAMSIRIAGFIGAGNLAAVRPATRAGVVLLLASATVAAGVFLGFGDSLLRFFTSDEAVLAMAATLLFPLALYQFADSMQTCYANALRGTSHVVSMMWIAFVSYILVNIPLGYLLAFPLGFGIRGIYFAFTGGLLCAAVLYASRFYKVLGKLH